MKLEDNFLSLMIVSDILEYVLQKWEKMYTDSENQKALENKNLK